MIESNRAELQTQAALYALGALTQHEARAFETCLAEGGGDAEEWRTFEAVVEALGFNAPEVEPVAQTSGRLRERLFE